MSWTNFKKPVLLILSLILLTTTGIGQSANIVTITVNSTEYDNPSLTGLKEYLKANSKVKGLKSTFNNSIATLNFTYSAAADELWEDIPADKKQGFKLTSLDNKTIKLQALKNSSPSTAATKTSSKNCGCDYFPICTYDVTKTYNGKLYKGVRNLDESIDYYNCDGGVVTKISSTQVPTIVTDNYGEAYATTIPENSMVTLLKTKEPIGTVWTMYRKYGYVYYTDYHTIVSKNATLEFNGKTYTDLLKINVIAKKELNIEEYSEYVFTYNHAAVGAEYQNTFYYKDTVYKRSNNYYYDKNLGLIKEENAWDEIKFKTINANQLRQSTPKHPLFNILISNDWISKDDFASKPQIFDLRLEFQKSGRYVLTWAEVKGDGFAVVPVKIKKFEGGYWRINGNWIETTALNDLEVWTKAFEVQKKSDGSYTLLRNSKTFTSGRSSTNGKDY